MVNVLFLIIYSVLADSLTPTILYYVLSAHCILLIIQHLREKKQVTPIFLYYVGVLLVNYSNVAVINKYNVTGVDQYSYLVPKFIGDATQIWCISVTCIFMGYQLAVTRSLPQIDFEISQDKILNTIFYVLIITRLSAILGNRIPFLGGAILKIFILLNSVGILFYARLWGKKDDKRYRMYALTLFALETYAALKFAFLRFELILPTVYLFTGYFIGKQKIKYLFSYRIIPFLVIISIYSSVFKSLQKNRNNFYAVIFENDVDADEKEKENSGALLERSSNLAQLTAIVRLVNTNGLYNGKASEPLLAAIIPRFIWPDKPLIQLGSWFALEITGTPLSGKTAGNSVNMTVPGELYLDFGWIGLVIGSFLFGAFFPFLWNSSNFYKSEYNLSGTVFGGYLLVVAVGGLGADLQIVITLMSIYFAFYVIRKLIKSK